MQVRLVLIAITAFLVGACDRPMDASKIACPGSAGQTGDVHTDVVLSEQIVICQQPVPVVIDAKDPVQMLTRNMTKVSVWRLPVDFRKPPLWTRTIPSGIGEVFAPSPGLPIYLCFQKPVTGAFPSCRYYEASSGRFALASSVPPSATVIYPAGTLVPIPRIAGVEVWASFIQPAEQEVLDPRGPQQPLMNRISYAGPQGPISIIGLRCDREKPGTIREFNGLKTRITMVADGAPPTPARSVPDAFQIVVTFFSPYHGQGEIEKAQLHIPVSKDRIDLEHAQVPAGCALALLAPSANGEDLVFDASVENALFSQADSLKKLFIRDDRTLASVARFANLEELDISCLEKLEKLPEAITRLAKLRVLNIDNGNGCIMNPELPESLGDLSELTTLVLYGAQDADGGQTRPLPGSLVRLKKLETLNIGRNQYGAVPEVVSGMTSLKTLDLSFNGLSDLPDSLLKLPQLTKVILDGNVAITCSKSKQVELRNRFRNIQLDFTNEYDC